MTTLTQPTAANSTQAVVNHHLLAFGAGDLRGVVSDYGPDSVLIIPNAVLRGVNEIRPLFVAMIAEFATPGSTFDLQEQVVEGDVAYIRWVGETADNVYELGTDTFFVRDGKIVTQTFAFKATPKH